VDCSCVLVLLILLFLFVNAGKTFGNLSVNTLPSSTPVDNVCSVVDPQVEFFWKIRMAEQKIWLISGLAEFACKL